MAVDLDPAIRAIAANHPKTNVMHLMRLIEDKDPMVRRACLKNSALPYQLLQIAFRDSDPAFGRTLG